MFRQVPLCIWTAVAAERVVCLVCSITQPCAVQLVNVCVWVAPNAILLRHDCLWFEPFVIWSAFTSWTCWNTIFLIMLIEAHNCAPWDKGRAAGRGGQSNSKLHWLTCSSCVAPIAPGIVVMWRGSCVAGHVRVAFHLFTVQHSSGMVDTSHHSLSGSSLPVCVCEAATWAK